ncbi:MAG: hypothetical protein IPP74_14035 [Alphaproteobacteria bacterium]|nr:hypothetical protein [Alphaproteobacteria bacterium]
MGNKPLQGMALKALIDTTLESWRFTKVFIRMMNKLDAAETTRFASQLNYYQEKLTFNLEQVNLRLVNVEGQIYEAGMAATALNISDFEAEDILLVEQMLEPIIMGPDGLVRSGTVLLRKTLL